MSTHYSFGHSHATGRTANQTRSNEGLQAGGCTNRLAHVHSSTHFAKDLLSTPEYSYFRAPPTAEPSAQSVPFARRQ